MLVSRHYCMYSSFILLVTAFCLKLVPVVIIVVIVTAVIVVCSESSKLTQKYKSKP